MKPFSQLSKRSQQRYILLAKLGVSIQAKPINCFFEWDVCNPQTHIIQWLETPRATHSQYAIRRTPRSQLP